jgi:hypothetical protein
MSIGLEKDRTMDAHARNPFGVMDVPDPEGRDVLDFAGGATLDGATNDENAATWCAQQPRDIPDSFNGAWASRWKGGADPTIPGDTADKWKQGQAELRTIADRVFLLFDWNGGIRRGLIEARLDNRSRLTGRYINLTSPEIIRPWIGLIVDGRRIDGRFPEGRLDFRR